MDVGKAVALLLVATLTVSITGFAGAYSGIGSIGGTPTSACNDGTDNDGDARVDGADPGCTKPYYADTTEGNIWDTDLTSVMYTGGSATSSVSLSSSDLSSDSSVFFAGIVRRGNDGTVRETPDSYSSGVLTENYIDAVYDESSGNYGNGNLASVAYSKSNFPSGTVFTSERAVDPPNPGMGSVSGSVAIEGSPQKCGDGNENDAEPGGPDGQNMGSDTGTPCKADYGRMWEKEDVRSPAEPDHQTSDQTTNNGLWCLDDDQDDSGNTLSHSCEDGNPGQCDGTGGNPPSCGDEGCAQDPDDGTCTDKSTGSQSTSADGSWQDSQSDTENNEYWYISGDTLIKDSCQDDGGWSQTGSAGNNPSCNTYSPSNYQCVSDCTCDPADPTCNPVFEPQSCSVSGTHQPCSSASSTTITGDYRSWQQANTIDCNRNNVVDGGGENSADDSSTNKPDNDPAGTFTDFTAYDDMGWNKVWCGYDSTLTVDADGPKGYGDGFVVIHEGSIVATEAPDGGDTVGQRVYVDGSSFQDFTHLIGTSCPGGKTTCLKYVDYQTVAGSGTAGSPEWTSVSGAVTMNADAYTADQSLSVCRAINRINKKNGNGNRLIHCKYEVNADAGGGDDAGPYTEACEDEPGEWWVYMEGPEVNNDASVMNDNPGHYQGCVDSSDTGRFGGSLDQDSCILKGEPVSEGKVANVEPDSTNDPYEREGNQPDWEVCLNIPGQGDDVSGDNTPSGDDKGGEWYDLDSETAQNYLRGGGSGLVSDTNPTGNTREINHYWRDNPNPSHPIHNPEGSSDGTALEDDCGNPRFSENDNLRCNDASDATSFSETREPTFYSFFIERDRDEDFHPQGGSPSPGSPGDFVGVINKLKDNSDQLEPGMDTSTYSMMSTGASVPAYISMWNTSEGTQSEADQWAITPNQSWSVSSRGTPYPPYGTYAHPEGDVRSGKGSDSIPKYFKAFGNSYAAVADTTLTDENGNTVNPGEGVWIDPDFLKEADNSGDYRFPAGSNWADEVSFSMDITGSDAGLGFDLGASASLTIRSPDGVSNSFVLGDIYFEGEDNGVDSDGDGSVDEGPGAESWEGTNLVGETVNELEPPMCGDDANEFLVEEMGESSNPKQFTGAYGCASVRTYCVDRSSGQDFFSRDNYNQVDEPDENFGRLKQDKEYCGQTEDGLSVWYDQDFGDVDGDGIQETCRDNTLYGSAGVRWISESYIEDYPHAVKGGVDDDWNSYIEQHLSVYPGKYDQLQSMPSKSSWSPPDFNSLSPVPTGSPNTSIATLGFCGGEDSDEYIITQRCNNRLCSTDTSVLGVADDPGDCILEGSQYPQISDSKRRLYDTGDNLTFDLGSSQRDIACFGGVWYEEWPVVFEQDTIDVEKGETQRVTFQLINVENVERTFDVRMENTDVAQFSEFTTESGNSFTATVPANSAEKYQVDIYGGDTTIDSSPLRVQADAVNSRVTGEDSVTVDIVNTTVDKGGARSGSENVPGIGMIQVMFIVLMSALLFFSQS